MKNLVLVATAQLVLAAPWPIASFTWHRLREGPVVPLPPGTEPAPSRLVTTVTARTSGILATSVRDSP